MKPLLVLLVALGLAGCGQEPIQEEFSLEELRFTAKPCPVLDHFYINNALCSDGDIYVYNKRTGRYSRVKLSMAVY